MKKKLLLIVALALTACVLSGCALPLMMSSFTRYMNAANNARREYPTEVEAEYPDYEYEAYEDAAYDGLAMAAMPMKGGAYMEPFNTEEYAAIAENGFRKVATDPLSTFSADVDTASYCNLRRMLNDDWYASNIPNGAVRVEEMLNYFRYDYPVPD